MDGVGYSGYTVTPYYDSMIVKYTVRGATFPEALARIRLVLQECRIRGVSTNIPFLLNVMTHPEFEKGIVTTSFIDQNPELKVVSGATWNFADEEQSSMKGVVRKEKLLRYLANLAVNGHPQELGADATKVIAASGAHSKIARPNLSVAPAPKEGSRSHRQILQEDGPEGYAKYVRNKKGLLLTDTTWRDAHQSLLATRMRTQELTNAAEFTNLALRDAFSLEMWGGAPSTWPCASYTNVPGSVSRPSGRRYPTFPFRCC